MMSTTRSIPSSLGSGALLVLGLVVGLRATAAGLTPLVGAGSDVEPMLVLEAFDKEAGGRWKLDHSENTACNGLTARITPPADLAPEPIPVLITYREHAEKRRDLLFWIVRRRAIQLHWNTNALLLDVIIHDDIHTQYLIDGTVWREGSLQITFDTHPEQGALYEPLTSIFTKNDSTFVVGLCARSRSHVFAEHDRMIPSSVA